MGEVVVSSESGMGLDVVNETRQGEEQKNRGDNGTTESAAGASSASNVMWERFLPKMVVSVLLVEADDSTRQIIAALLRKCSYRVAAVSDGLKAWEVLKARPHNIDLILTEVELPSISGYALLTLIMEHDVCKNIPVIMMSSHDSVSTVYKCMLRGAADFLVKPVRKNELRNLWQHVWRKQASSGAAGPGPPDESETQQKVEATAENNAVSNHSSGYVAACIQRNRECIEKGSDAQSSCTKPELETEGAENEHVHCPSTPKSATFLSDNTKIPTREEIGQENVRTQARDNEARTQAHESQAAASMDANCATTRAQDKKSDYCSEQANVIDQNSINNHANEGSSREAIDLIGAFDNYLKGNLINSVSNASTNKFDILPLLDLSLRRSLPSASVNQVNDERHRLNHSDASAFSRYVNKPLQACNSTSPSTCNQQKDHKTNSEKQLSNYTPDYYSNTHGTTISPQNHCSVAKKSEIAFPCPQQREISHPIPVRGYENVMNAYGSLISQVYCTQSGPSPMPSPGTMHHSESLPHSNHFYPSDRQPSGCQQFHNLMDQRMSNAVDQTSNKQGQKLENLEDWGNISSANDQSGNSSFCNGNISHHQSAASGSNGMISAISGVKAASECGNEEGFYIHEGASSRTTLREAALTKFRLKRKERCFEKKVRYESRKKLAEQRPRVKGQFVRQVTNDSQPGNSSAD